MSEKKIRVRLVHSTIGRNKKQDEIVKGLGLRKLGNERYLEDTPAIRGMITKISHLVKIVEEDLDSKISRACKAGKSEVKNEAQ